MPPGLRCTHIGHLPLTGGVIPLVAANIGPGTPQIGFSRMVTGITNQLAHKDLLITKRTLIVELPIQMWK